MATEPVSSPPSPLVTAGKLADLVFWLAACGLLFWALGTRGLWTAEGRWAEIAREMLLSGSYFHPTINGVPYFDKPLMSYWLIVLAAPLTGMSEWALRIPSAVCGLVALWATRRLGAMLGSREIGRLAGWILLTSYGFLKWARTGEADMANLAFIMLAIVWYWRRRYSPCFVTYFIFYVIMFVGAQMKGLTAIIIPILAVFLDLLRENRWKHLLKPAHFIALAGAALVYIVPFLFSAMTRDHTYQSDGLSLVFRENIQRFFDPFDHIEPWYAYFEHVPTLFLPWSPVLVIALLAVIFSTNWRRYTWPNVWLGLAMGLIFLFFTASGSRRSYYILPLMPLCAIFSARLLLSSTRGLWRRAALGLQSAIALLLTAAVLLAALILPFMKNRLPFQLSAGNIAALLVLGLLSATAWLLLRARGARLESLFGAPPWIAVLLATNVLFFGAYFCFFEPGLFETFRTERSFARNVRQTGRPAADIAFYQHYLENVVFYLDAPPPYHPIISTSSDAYAYLNEAPGERVIILRRRALPDLLASFPPGYQGGEAVKETSFPWEKEKKLDKKLVAWTLGASKEQHERSE